MARSQEPAIGGPFCEIRDSFSERRNAWLTWEDSNFQITIPKKAFEMSTEFPLIWPKIRLGDFCSFELCTEQTHRWVRRNASLGRSTSVLANPDTGHRLSPNQKQTRSRWPYLGLEKAAPLSVFFIATGTYRLLFLNHKDSALRRAGHWATSGARGGLME